MKILSHLNKGGEAGGVASKERRWEGEVILGWLLLFSQLGVKSMRLALSWGESEDYSEKPSFDR